MTIGKIINIGIIGIGTIGKRHLMAINQVNDINIVGVVDITEAAQNFCSDKNIPFFKSLNDLLKNHEVDGVVISTPTINHHENAIAALKVGLDVLIEKPISSTVVESEEIAGIAIKYGC